MIVLAHAGLSDLTEEDVRNLWWYILVFASLVPACVCAFVGGWRDPAVLGIAAVQAVLLVMVIRGILQWARRRFQSDMASSAIISVAYFPACLVSNLIWLLGVLALAHFR